jgi:transcriptional regulator with XRE-family HTH domain
MKGVNIMLFGDKVKELRTLVGMSQQELANNASLSLRSIQNYESNQRYPKDVAILNKLCKVLNTTIEDLMKEEDNFIHEAAQKYCTRGKRDAKKLVEEVGGLFAGGELNEEAKDKVFRAITEMYWKSKDNNNKYTPKKYSEDNST